MKFSLLTVCLSVYADGIGLSDSLFGWYDRILLYYTSWGPAACSFSLLVSHWALINANLTWL